MTRRNIYEGRVGPETERKEQHFRGILGGIHIPACEGIRGKYGKPGDPPYLFADLHAGPGRLPWGGKEFDGSPLIALDLLAASRLRHTTLHFEHDHEVAMVLRHNTYQRHPGSVGSVISEEFETTLTAILARDGVQPYQYGLAYSDPSRGALPVEAFNTFAYYRPRVDLLAYVAANQHYKRANANGNGHGRLLAADISAVRKRYALIREPNTDKQYTFIFWSDYPFGDWRKEGFHRLDSEHGRYLLDWMNLTREGFREKWNTPLPFAETDPDPPYRTYQEYLRHPRFRAVRDQVFARAGGVCEWCGLRPPTEPHHLRYPPWGAFDVPENLVAICHQCHCDAHGKAS